MRHSSFFDSLVPGIVELGGDEDLGTGGPPFRFHSGRH